MYDSIRAFKNYLEFDRRFTEEKVVTYLGNLPMVFDQLNINRISDINPDTIQNAWKKQRWIIREDGIEISETSESGSFAALKLFLQYLEEKNLIRGKEVSKAIRISEEKFLPIAGLRNSEIRALKKYLVFNVSNDTQRKETALIFLMLDTGISLRELSLLNISTDGKLRLKLNQRSGHFIKKEEGVFVIIKNEDGAEILHRLSEETQHFLQFYIENRVHQHRYLFTGSIRSGNVKRITPSSIQRIIEKIFTKAKIIVKKGSAARVLSQTVRKKQSIEMRPSRQIIVMNESLQKADAKRIVA